MCPWESPFLNSLNLHILIEYLLLPSTIPGTDNTKQQGQNRQKSLSSWSLYFIRWRQKISQYMNSKMLANYKCCGEKQNMEGAGVCRRRLGFAILNKMVEKPVEKVTFKQKKTWKRGGSEQCGYLWEGLSRQQKQHVQRPCGTCIGAQEQGREEQGLRPERNQAQRLADQGWCLTFFLSETGSHYRLLRRGWHDLP